MKALLALSALLLASPLFASSAEAGKDCRGFKSAHCHCQAVGYAHIGTKDMPVGSIKGEAFFTFTVPGQCFNQQMDYGLEHMGRGCWLACRQSFGVEHEQHAGVIAMKQAAAVALAKRGICGGYMQAELGYSAGTNKFRNATGSPIAFGLHGWKKVGGKDVCK